MYRGIVLAAQNYRLAFFRGELPNISGVLAEVTSLFSAAVWPRRLVRSIRWLVYVELSRVRYVTGTFFVGCVIDEAWFRRDLVFRAEIVWLPNFFGGLEVV